MKAKITLREMETIRPNVIKAGYCHLQWLLRHKSPDLYCASGAGWKCNVYLINDDVAVVTGYHTGSNKRGLHLPYAVCKKYDETAKNEIWYSKDFDYQEAARIKAADDLIERFISDVLNNQY